MFGGGMGGMGGFGGRGGFGGLRVIRIAALVLLLVLGAVFHKSGSTYTTLRVLYYALVLGLLFVGVRRRQAGGYGAGGYGRGRFSVGGFGRRQNPYGSSPSNETTSPSYPPPSSSPLPPPGVLAEPNVSGSGTLSGELPQSGPILPDASEGKA